ncbi:hypothetical protein B0H14DRAFT_2563692 [Mycena olivaceomarginata]|nr:hypothetical protein B0H14DRAFT_2563692 [Mycena olivaceomarginata]
MPVVKSRQMQSTKKFPDGCNRGSPWIGRTLCAWGQLAGGQLSANALRKRFFQPRRDARDLGKSRTMLAPMCVVPRRDWTNKIDLEHSRFPNAANLGLANAAKSSARHPCTNAPGDCPVPGCAEVIWKYNLKSHIEKTHTAANLDAYKFYYEIDAEERTLLKTASFPEDRADAMLDALDDEDFDGSISAHSPPEEDIRIEEPNASPPAIEHHDDTPTSPLSNRPSAATRVPDTLHEQDTAEPPRPRPRPRPKVQLAVSLVEPTPSSLAAPFADAPVQGDMDDPEDAIVPPHQLLWTNLEALKACRCIRRRR